MNVEQVKDGINEKQFNNSSISKTLQSIYSGDNLEINIEQLDKIVESTTQLEFKELGIVLDGYSRNLYETYKYMNLNYLKLVDYTERFYFGTRGTHLTKKEVNNIIQVMKQGIKNKYYNDEQTSEEDYWCMVYFVILQNYISLYQNPFEKDILFKRDPSYFKKVSDLNLIPKEVYEIQHRVIETLDKKLDKLDNNLVNEVTKIMEDLTESSKRVPFNEVIYHSIYHNYHSDFRQIPLIITNNAVIYDKKIDVNYLNSYLELTNIKNVVTNILSTLVPMERSDIKEYVETVLINYERRYIYSEELDNKKEIENAELIHLIVENANNFNLITHLQILEKFEKLSMNL